MLLLPLTTAVGTLTALLLLERLAASLGLIDRPGGHKRHASPTPVVGGLGMAVGLGIGGLAFFLYAETPWIWICALLLVGLGAWDDATNMKASRKMLLQAAIVALGILAGGFRLDSLGELLPGLSVTLGALALPVTVFSMVGLVNAVNMLDGADGLAGIVTLMALAWLAGAAALLGADGTGQTLLATIASLLVFMLFNARTPWRPRARMFMGDAGSMMLGFVLGWAAIELSQRPGGLPPVCALWIAGLPVLDTVVTSALRIARGTHPFKAGGDHIHHLLIARTGSVTVSVMLIGAVSAMFGAVGTVGWLARVPQWILFAAFMAVAALYGTLVGGAWSRLRPRMAELQAAATGAARRQSPAP